MKQSTVKHVTAQATQKTLDMQKRQLFEAKQAKILHRRDIRRAIDNGVLADNRTSEKQQKIYQTLDELENNDYQRNNIQINSKNKVYDPSAIAREFQLRKSGEAASSRYVKSLIKETTNDFANLRQGDDWKCSAPTSKITDYTSESG